MARWVAIFDDDPKALKLREDHHEAHFQYLALHAGKIRIAGGLRPEPGGTFCGGLWVLEVESRAEAARLCEDDPYFRLGLRTRYQIYAWGKAPIYDDVIL
ncbi:MAG: YciI family protein [Hyphomicrobiales bacterium]|nr:YciI family protein [Hyphomicrobiales bacterium]